MTPLKKLSLTEVYQSKTFQRFLSRTKSDWRMVRDCAKPCSKKSRRAGSPPVTGLSSWSRVPSSSSSCLKDCAQKFNAEQTDDLCSTADFCDVLATARNMLVQAAEAARPRDHGCGPRARYHGVTSVSAKALGRSGRSPSIRYVPASVGVHQQPLVFTCFAAALVASSGARRAPPS